jgi:hypothetical protein
LKNGIDVPLTLLMSRKCLAFSAQRLLRVRAVETGYRTWCAALKPA